MDAELRRKLKRLGVVKGLKNLQLTPSPRPSPPPTTGIGSAELPGEEIQTPYGPAWVIKRRYAAEHRHGLYTLEEASTLTPEVLALLGQPNLGAYPAFLDTETTGLAGGTGTLIFLTGVGLWQSSALQLHQVFLRDPGEERAALHYLEELLSGASSLLTFNGQGFDLPLLESRFILQRMPPRWRSLPHLDLLSVARTLWREHLPSRRLGFIESEVLEIYRTQEDYPSWMIPMAYRTYLQTGITDEMIRILYHNEIDILSLLTLLVHVGRLVEDPRTMNATAAEWVGLGRLQRHAGDAEATRAAWLRALEEDTLPTDIAERLWKEIGLQYKRDKDWEAALETWQCWADRIPWALEPLVERAKYYEWVAHNLDAALEETNTALERAETHRRGAQKQRWCAELRHRQERLHRKQQRSCNAKG